MSVRRIVPNIGSTQPDLCEPFYSGFLGLHQAMNMGWIATYVSPDNPTAQVSVAKSESSEAFRPAISIEVDDVDRLHGEAVARGLEIVYPLTDEPWGVRRFAVADPNGVVVNIMCHVHQPSGEPKPA